jgi:Holliday junction resolvase RusA-like endonuclease
VEDALNGVAWADDGQVVSQFASKRYAFSNEKPGVCIGIMPGEYQ